MGGGRAEKKVGAVVVGDVASWVCCCCPCAMSGCSGLESLLVACVCGGRGIITWHRRKKKGAGGRLICSRTGLDQTLPSLSTTRCVFPSVQLPQLPMCWVIRVGTRGVSVCCLYDTQRPRPLMDGYQPPQPTLHSFRSRPERRGGECSRHNMGRKYGAKKGDARGEPCTSARAVVEGS